MNLGAASFPAFGKGAGLDLTSSNHQSRTTTVENCSANSGTGCGPVLKSGTLAGNGTARLYRRHQLDVCILCFGRRHNPSQSVRTDLATFPGRNTPGGNEAWASAEVPS